MAKGNFIVLFKQPWRVTAHELKQMCGAQSLSRNQNEGNMLSLLRNNYFSEMFM